MGNPPRRKRGPNSSNPPYLGAAEHKILAALAGLNCMDFSNTANTRELQQQTVINENSIYFALRTLRRKKMIRKTSHNYQARYFLTDHGLRCLDAWNDWLKTFEDKK